MKENDIYDRDPQTYNWGLTPLHEKQLEMLSDIDRFCQNNGIEYSLAYGSVLGYARHGGMIPWDDDIDLYMTVSEYDRFRTCFRNNGNHEKYYLQETDALEGMCELPKLRMNGTTCLEPIVADLDMHHGIYIDIFIIHGAPDSAPKKYFQNLWNQYLALKGLSNRHYMRKPAFRPILAFMRLFPYHFLRGFALKQVYKYDNIETKQLYDPDLRTFRKSFFDRNVIFPVRRIQFSGVETFVPNDTEKYLKQCYGDYMQLPGMESILGAQHAGIWKTDEDFRKYAPNVKDFSDEKGRRKKKRNAVRG